MEKPLRILFKKIPLNYSWIPFPQKLTVTPMLLGYTINLKDEKFSEYIKNVEKWDNELSWKNTTNINFSQIAINKSKKPIAATITINERGKIHLLPKTTKISNSKTIELLVGLATKKEPQEYCWLELIEVPKHDKNEDLWKRHANPKEYRNLFSIDNNKIIKAVQTILKDLDLLTNPTTKLHQKDFERNRIIVQIISTKGKVEAQNNQINQLSKLIENQRKKQKIILIANTYKDVPINKRTNKEHIDQSMKIFLETNNTIFLTTLSLYNLWKKVITNQISTPEASSLILSEIGEIQI